MGDKAEIFCVPEVSIFIIMSASIPHFIPTIMEEKRISYGMTFIPTSGTAGREDGVAGIFGPSNTPVGRPGISRSMTPLGI
jgi:hypothetical protein